MTVCAIFLERGEAAPFKGLLKTSELAAQSVAGEEAIQKRVEAALASQAQLHRIERDGREEQHQITLDAKDAEIDLWQKAAEDAAPSWYEKPWFVATVSVLGAVAIVTGSVYVFDRLKEGD